MIVCLDVDYRADAVVAACVGFDAWTDAKSSLETTTRSATDPASYAPGEFYRRELPYLLGILGQLTSEPDIIVVDGYVWLDEDKPGLGAHLHKALGGRPVVIGVAKRSFRSATRAIAVVRGKSSTPLFVGAVGVESSVAASHVSSMHGAHRIPTLLKRVDRLSRS